MIKKTARNLQLIKIINNNPGIKFREIMRATGMKNGVLSHHLGKLENSGTVTVQRNPRQTRFFPLHISQQESKVIKALRRQTTRDILSALILKENIQFNEIVAVVKKAPSTVSRYLTMLVDDGIVSTNLFDRKKTYAIKNRIIIDKLIEQYRPSFLERPTSGLEDIINSL